VKFLTDQDVYEVTVLRLVALAHDVTRARELGLSRATDEQLLQRADREGRVLVTRDKGFGQLVFLHGQAHSGVILLRIDPISITPVHE
jgi:predicted nuclease of predicted toxin-antitoxin system